MTLGELFKRFGKRTEKVKGEHIFTQGIPDRTLYLVQSGILKAYYTSADGKEFIKSFLSPGDVIGSLTSAVSGDNCSFSLICLEPATLVAIPFDTIQEYSKDDLELATTLIDLLLNFGMKKEKREFELLCLSAEERFRQLLESTPELLDKVTQNDLARYLGITPVGLSRIKKRVIDRET